MILPFIVSGFFGDNVPFLISLWSFLSVFGIGYLIPVARYMALRYRLSRTSWRGIRGFMGGSSWEYGRLALGWNIMTALTLGILKPKYDMEKARYKYGNFYIGNLKANFGGDAAAVRKDYWVSWGIGVYCVVLSILLFAIPAVWESKGHGSELGGLMRFVGVISLFGGLPLARVWYKTAFLRECVNNFSVGGIAFSTDLTFTDLLKFYLINIAILVFTLGLGRPVVLQRKMRFVTEHLCLHGDIDSQEIRQAKDMKPSFAEGLDDILDLDTGLM